MYLYNDTFYSNVSPAFGGGKLCSITVLFKQEDFIVELRGAGMGIKENRQRDVNALTFPLVRESTDSYTVLIEASPKIKILEIPKRICHAAIIGQEY